MICRSPWKALLRRLRRAARSSDGFTMVEMMIALAVMALMFTGTAIVLGSALTGASETRLKQHSVETATEILEGIRNLDYATVATQSTSDLTTLQAAGYITQVSAGPPPTYSFDPDGTGPLAAEAVVTRTSLAIDSLQVLDRNGAQYKVRAIVTDPPGDELLKRITARVSWVQNGRTFERQMTTLSTETRRGLPLPNFAVGDDITSPLVQPVDGVLTFPVQITNNGARDTWNLTATAVPTPTWLSSIVWYADLGSIGTYSAADDVPLTDTNGDLIPDTGTLETDEKMHLLGRVNLASVTPAATTGMFVVTPSLVSASQPGTPARSIDITYSLTASSACAGCTYTDVWLHNRTTAGASVQQTSPMPANYTIPTQTSLPNYDTDKDAYPGRLVGKDSLDYTQPSNDRIAKWNFQAPTATVLTGGNNIKVKVWVAMKDLAWGTAIINAYVRYSSTSATAAGVAVGSGFGTVTVSPPAGGWVLAEAVIPITSDFTVANNKYLRVFVTVGNGSTGDVWLGYDADVSGAYKASVIIPKQ